MVRMRIASVGLLVAGALVCSANARQQGSAETSRDASTTGKSKSKKVWTNDDMADVTGTISVVGTPTAQHSGKLPASPISSFQPGAVKPTQNKTADAAKRTDGVDAKTLAQLRQQLQKLQTNIDQLDKQIEQLKGASRGDSKNLGGLKADTWSYSTASVPDQIKSLEAKRSALQATMDNLLDAARASGIEPGQLR